MWIFLIIAAVIIALLLLPVRAEVIFDEELTVKIGYLFFNYTLLPSKEKKRKEVKKVEPKTARKKKPSAMKQLIETEGIFGAMERICSFLCIVLEKLKKLLSHATINPLILKIAVAGKEAAETAQNHGKICAVLYPTVSILNAAIHVKKQDITVLPRFNVTDTKVFFHAAVHIPVLFFFPVLTIAFDYFKRFGTEQQHKIPTKKGT